MTDTAESEAGGPNCPLSGVRVLEVSTTRAARIAGQLLSDLGADVVRAIDDVVDPALPSDPGEVWWDRGKRLMQLGSDEIRHAVHQADTVIVDHTPSRLTASGLGSEQVRSLNLEATHVWMPPYAAVGRWAELHEDPLLLDAIGGIAGRYPCVEDRPVAPVVATTSILHGVLGAGAAVAGLVGRNRTGSGHTAVVGGLHAAGTQMATMMIEGLDQPVFSPGRSVKSLPFWRMYQAADGQWFFLATLTPDLFIRALDALDRMDILVLPDVAGEFTNLMVTDGPAVRAVEHELEALFATRPCAHWIDTFAAADVPCAPVRTWSEWAASDIVEANHGMTRVNHDVLGTVTMPNVPISLSRSAVRAARAAVVVNRPRGVPVWPRRNRAAHAGSTTVTQLPLHGIKVIDAATFLAAPLVATLLADHGAEVVKVEPPSGDPYRAFALSFVAANQRKRGVALGLGTEPGCEALLDLVQGADVLVENLRPGRLEKLGLGAETLRRHRPGLVHCTISAYGHAGEHATAPGFDPVFQALSGMAVAQGGEDRPLAAPMPAHDTCTGALGALGVMAALYERGTSGSGQQVWTSLANTSTFLQGSELTNYTGRPAPQRGGVDHPGPSEGHRYYACIDGWIGTAALSGARNAEFFRALGVGGLSEIEQALAQRTVEETLTLLGDHGVPACRVLEQAGALEDPFLQENRLSHVVTDPQFGRLRMVRTFTQWVDGVEGSAFDPTPGRSFAVGEDSREVLAGLGYTDARIESVLGHRAAAQHQENHVSAT
ncbi:CoA transferase [Rhodococcus oxybenzonivorans]|uniref:CaiB/BaiF CoA-transferase family protein n=1 Tax=Rhodococcus oxybenzonivorans TaxID=1990687 RepID=UPI0029538485|nr:CoA transferase [Rhodococcus oxybenzonivorans]MDV7352794.1 CoA transferase [Rhodococcus oxybenzonivorans]